MDNVITGGAPAGAVISGTVKAEQGSASITLNDLIDRYIMAYTGRDKTRHARVGWWRSRLGDRVLTSITDEDVFQALEAYANAPARVYGGKDDFGARIWRAKSKPPSGGSINRHHCCLSALFKWAEEARILPRGYPNPARFIRRRREAMGVVRFLTDDERARLLEATKTSDRRRATQWRRLYLLVLMALTTGARRGELLALTWADLDGTRKVAHIHTSKNGESRALPLTAAVLAQLKRVRRKKESLDALIFASRIRPKQPYHVQGVWAKAVAAARIKNFRFHDLRHTCASYLAQSGASILEVADVLGHKDLKMTRRYAHLSQATKAAVVNRVLGDIR